jgi:hypothetical protein
MVRMIRGQRVMLDSDLAGFYGVETKRLLEQVRRNKHRFPDDFAFMLNNEEFATLRSQIATSKTASEARGGRRTNPWVFTEHGAVMLASVLNSAVAIAASVQIVRAFVNMNNALSASDLVGKLVDLEKRLSGHDDDIAAILNVIRQLAAPQQPQRAPKEIGFHTLREDAEECPELAKMPRKVVRYNSPKRTRKEKK